MNRNERAPRTMSECQWHTGYPTVPRSERKTGEGWFVLACLICAVLGILATYWRA